MSNFDFDFEKYQRQCLSVAEGFLSLYDKKITFEKYETIISKANLLAPTAVANIEKEIIIRGNLFRPIDAYQF